MNATLAIILVLIIGCSGAAQAQPDPTSTLSAEEELEQIRREVGASPAKAVRAESRDADVEALLKRIEALEARVDALQWTELDAIRVVQWKLWERLEACQLHSHRLSQGYGLNRDYNLPSSTEKGGDCNSSQDPVLIALGVGGRPVAGFNFVVSTGKWLLENGEWAAIYEADSDRWRVQATGSELRPVVAFYAYERTGIVEGVAPP